MIWSLLLSLLVKSGVIAAVALIAAPRVARTAQDRVDILRAAVCLLLALPVLGLALPDLDLRLPSAPAAPAAQTVDLWRGEVGPVAGVAVSANLSGLDPVVWIVGAWLSGLAVLGGRLAFGLLTLDRWTREGRPVERDDWLSELRRLSPLSRPRLIASDRAPGPLSWGVSPGVVLLDPATLAERDSAAAVLAHELAHLRRRDWLFLILSRTAVAVFWFNPLVWKLHAALVARSEEAADAAALKSVDRRLYAKALVRLASSSPQAGPRVATAMAADARTLKKRIACIMSDAPARRRPLTVALAIAALTVAATPLAALEIDRQAVPLPPVPPVPPLASTVPAAPVAAVPPAPPAPPAPPVPPAPPAGNEFQYSYGLWYSSDEASPEALAAAAEARARAEEARSLAAEARLQAESARRDAEEAQRRLSEDARPVRFVAASASRDIDLTRVRAEAEAARAAGEEARRAGERARLDGERAKQRARIDLARGAEDMRRGARQLREESLRLRDPAYRAREIERRRERGDVVTDEELRALSLSLPGHADIMERQAEHMARQARQEL